MQARRHNGLGDRGGRAQERHFPHRRRLSQKRSCRQVGCPNSAAAAAVQAQLRCVLPCRRSRSNGKPKRDEYMRQIIDTKGVLNRLAINADETERGIIEEFEENQYESREAVKYAGVLPLAWPRCPGACNRLGHALLLAVYATTSVCGCRRAAGRANTDGLHLLCAAGGSLPVRGRALQPGPLGAVLPRQGATRC